MGRDVTEPWYLDVVMSPLLAAARNTYIGAVRRALEAAGLGDLPRRGPFVLGAVANRGSTLVEAVAGLHISKQAASQLIDLLVMRGYLDRSPDPDDRRRVIITLTDRGRAAALETGEAIAAVDAVLVARVGADTVASLRAGLGALVELGEDPHFSD